MNVLTFYILSILMIGSTLAVVYLLVNSVNKTHDKKKLKNKESKEESKEDPLFTFCNESFEENKKFVCNEFFNDYGKYSPDYRPGQGISRTEILDWRSKRDPSHPVYSGKDGYRNYCLSRPNEYVSYDTWVHLYGSDEKLRIYNTMMQCR